MKATIEVANASILDVVVSATRAAQAKWVAYHERSIVLGQDAQLFRSNSDSVARLEVIDVLKCLAEAMSANGPSGAGAMEYFGALAQTGTGDITYCECVPLSVCAGIGAWNLAPSHRLLSLPIPISTSTCVFVQASIAANFEATLVERAHAMWIGRSMAKDVQMDALISERHLLEVLNYASDGIVEGTTFAAGSKRVHQ